LEDGDGFVVFVLGYAEHGGFEFGEGFGDVAPVGVLFYGEGDVDGHLVAAVEPSDEGGEGEVDDEEDKEEVEEAGEEECHAGYVDEDEFVHEDGEVHEGKEVDEVCAMSGTEIRPPPLQEALFLSHCSFTLKIENNLAIYLPYDKRPVVTIGRTCVMFPTSL
jgi:hypothetical protein